MADRLRLGVIFGGRSAEHEVSVASAINVLDAAEPGRFEVTPFGVTRAGRWLTPDESRAQLAAEAPPFKKRIEGDVPRLMQRPEVLDALAAVDVVFPLVHGVNGEDGTLQGMLEMFGLPYAGCGVAASAIGMDKALQKDLFLNAGLEVAPFLVVELPRWRRMQHEMIEGVEDMLGYPVFVKPANGGSSVGVSKARSREDIGSAIETALRYDSKVLVEEAVAGREVECGVLGNWQPEASPVGEIVPGGEFYDYAAKYLEESARLIAPADIDDGVADTVREYAADAFEAIGGSGFARVDFFIPPDGEPLVNEINTLPGFTTISMFPRLWGLAGISYADLIGRIADLALERHAEREAHDA